jgi:hypothetical protein
MSLKVVAYLLRWVLLIQLALFTDMSKAEEKVRRKNSAMSTPRQLTARHYPQNPAHSGKPQQHKAVTRVKKWRVLAA